MQRYNFFCIFENNFVLLRKIVSIMKRICLFFLVMLSFLQVTAADLVAVNLTNGSQVYGELIFENDDVVVLRDQQGRRFQYPKLDVQNIQRQATLSTENVQDVVKAEEPKKVAIRVLAGAGAVTLPKQAWGTDLSAEFQIGTYDLGHRHIFLGGSIGYHGVLLAQTYSYIPIQVVTSIPLLSGRHSPSVGFGLGYGVSAHHTRGGLCAGVDIDYRYAFGSTSALMVGIYSRFQQDNLTTYPEVYGTSYRLESGHSLVSVGAHFAIIF